MADTSGRRRAGVASFRKKRPAILARCWQTFGDPRPFHSPGPGRCRDSCVRCVMSVMRNRSAHSPGGASDLRSRDFPGPRWLRSHGFDVEHRREDNETHVGRRQIRLDSYDPRIVGFVRSRIAPFAHAGSGLTLPRLMAGYDRRNRRTGAGSPVGSKQYRRRRARFPHSNFARNSRAPTALTTKLGFVSQTRLRHDRTDTRTTTTATQRSGSTGATGARTAEGAIGAAA
jgi:hypothetical protein